MSVEEMLEAQRRMRLRRRMRLKVRVRVRMMKLNSKIHLGQPNPEVFSGGPSDKSILTKYGRHIARCIYLNGVSYLIVQLYLNFFIFLFMV
jgi:hypothetical protein